MPTTIKLKNSVTTTNAPSSLVQGEVAINITDKKVWVGNAATTPIQLLGTGADGTFTNISVSSVATFGAGTSSAPSITTTGDTNTGIFFPAADTIAFTEGGVESMRIDSSGNVGIGTSSPSAPLDIQSNSGGTGIRVRGRASANAGAIRYFANDNTTQRARIESNDTNLEINSISSLPITILTADTERMRITSGGNVGIGTSSPKSVGNYTFVTTNATTGSGYTTYVNGTEASNFYANSSATVIQEVRALPLVFETNSTERMRINSAGDLLIGKTAADDSTPGFRYSVTNSSYYLSLARNGEPLYINRITTDGTLVGFAQDSTLEGNISVSGTTVSYNGGHLSRWSQLPDGSKDESIVKGTVMSNLDDMCVWEKDGVVAENEQLNKMKVSDVEGDTNVAGVFVNWTKDEQYDVDDMNVAMTGDMIIRIADGVVVQKGDLLMSAGDGTAKPQGDDIVRSKTVAKVTSNYVTCTYADGSYCVPCVLMAC